jgi:hypothetical protein
MAQAIAGNAARDDTPALGQEIPQEPDIFEIDGTFFNAKPARPTTLKKPAAAATSAAIAPSTAASATFTFHNHLPLQ